MTPLLDIQHLYKSFGRIQAVKNISLSVLPGEIYVLIGPNGAGKTTTIQCIAGLLEPTKGIITVKSHNITTDPACAIKAPRAHDSWILKYEH